ncbi:MAG: hypothetical protein Q8M16_14225, partial [Pirellulaceae bacterium]|nr:hypothetical protein [Pirellulaceae bacterium]
MLTACLESIWRVPTWHQKTDPTAKLTAARVLPVGERRPREIVPSSPHESLFHIDIGRQTINKPISTWTQTFFKLGYTLRRIWHDEPDYANNYTPLALEVLEDRQMLSGTGADDPNGTGGPGQPANGIDGGAAEVSQVVSANPGAGYSEQATLRLSEHWRANSNASYAWNQGPTLLSYFGTHASGTTTGVNYHAEVAGFDKDLGTYQISFYIYNYTITVSRSSNNGTGGMGDDFDEPSAANWYKEHLSVSVNGYSIETDNQLIAADFIDNGQFNNFNSATFKSIGSHSGSANYTFTGTIDPNVTNTYSRVDVVLNEQFQQSYNYQTTVDSFWDRGGLPGNVTVEGTVQVSGNSQANRHSSFDSSKTSTGRNFNVSGNSTSSSNRTITYTNASLTITTAGFSPVDIANATEATMRTRNEDGTYVAPPTEGSRYKLTLNGTQTNNANSSSNFSGNGSILTQGTNRVRTGIVNYSANASSVDTNDYVRTYTSDQTILGATIVYGLSLGGGGSRKIEKGGSQDIDVAVLHSHNHTIDKNRSEAELNYKLKHDYSSDGKVKQTTQMVNSLTGLGLSFYRLKDDYNIETTYRAVEQLQRNKPTSNSTDFNRTSGNVKLVGPSSQQTAYTTTTISAQPGFAHETMSTGTVLVTGTNNLTRTATKTSISSFKSRTNESIMTSAAIELLRNSDGSVTAPPPMVGVGDGSLRTVNNSGSTRRLHDSISQQWSFAATGVVTLTDTSTYRAYTTQSTGDGDVTLKSKLDVTDAPGAQGNSRSDEFDSHIFNATTAGGLNGLSGRQEYWTTGAGAAIATAAVGEATVILQNLVITFTPRPTPQNNNENEVQAVATGSSNGRKYDRTKSGTSTHIRIGDHTDAGTDKGHDRVSGRSITMPSTAGETGTGGTGTGETILTHFDRDSWDKITGGRGSYSLTDVYSFSVDDSFTIRTTGWSDGKANDTGNVGYKTALGSQSGNAG